jgi:hypothetical protein
MLLRSKVVVVSAGEKADLIRQVSDGKVSASKPLMTHRNAFQLLSKRAEACTARISVGVTCLRTTWQPVYRRHELITGLDTERGNLAWNAKGKDQVVTTMSLNTNDHARGGAVRSSDEKAGMALERRNCVIQSEKSDQPD